MQLIHRATLVGSISIILWGTLALLTRLTEGAIPPFQMMAMTFFIAFLLMLSRWLLNGHCGLQHVQQPPLAWIFRLPLLLFSSHE